MRSIVLYRQVSSFVRVIALSIAVFSVTTNAFAFSAGSNSTSALFAPVPIVFPGEGNVPCSLLNASADPAFAHIDQDWELKKQAPVQGSHPFENGPGLELTGPENPDLFVSIVTSSDLVITGWALGPLTTPPLDRVITAVIVKGGSVGTNVYVYPSGAIMDTGIFTTAGGVNAISHVSFCFDSFIAPTAAPASINGRVVQANGRGIANAVLTLRDHSSGEVFTRTSNSFGYYTFHDMEITHLYTLSVRSKLYRFGTESYTFTLDSDMFDMNFVSTQ